LSNSQLGDFQTPPALANQIVELVGKRAWDRVLEPTCGTGSFLRASATLRPREMLGIELQAAYAEQARRFAPVVEGDIFTMNLARDLPWCHASGSLLVVGNPPWVTNAQLGVLRSDNLPPKRNLRRLRGIDAMTGSSNFDIAEYIWLKLIADLRQEEPTIALLCKTSVARNVLAYAAQHALPIRNASLYHIDAKKWFGVSADACLFVVEVLDGANDYTCRSYPSLEACAEDGHTIGVVGGRLVSDTAAYSECRLVDGVSPVEWRQGIKHDASSVMELEFDGTSLFTKSGELVELEPAYVFPMLSGTDIFHGRTVANQKRMIVTQRNLQDDPGMLSRVAPRLWAYLTANRAVLDGRKSSIYQGRPSFCMFGVGGYSFSPFKVAVSGLHKKARFRAVGPADNRPVMLDDTCYFTPAATALRAAALSALLNSSGCQKAIESIVFWDAKRPITKKLLQRLDLRRVAETASRTELRSLSTEALGCDLRLPVGADVLSGLDELLEAWSTNHQETFAFDNETIRLGAAT
jgi:hypothetical protein